MRTQVIKWGSIGLVIVVLGLCLCLWVIYWKGGSEPSTVSAAEAGDIQLLKTLQQKGMSLDYHDPRKYMWTPLMAGVYAGNSNIVAYLLKQKVDIEARDTRGRTALIWAVNVAGKDLSIVEMLLENGAKTNVTDNSGLNVFGLAKANPQKDRLFDILSRAPRPK